MIQRCYRCSSQGYEIRDGCGWRESELFIGGHLGTKREERTINNLRTKETLVHRKDITISR